jgi:amidophosphoribosyltransferase
MCGIFGVFGHKEAAQLTYLGLYALQHRGQESAGIAVSDGEQMRTATGMGLVGEAFRGTNLEDLVGNKAIGHVRYSTTGSSKPANAQPLHVSYSRGELAVAHNGNLVNAGILHDELEAYGSIFRTTTDSEIILHLMAKPNFGNLETTLVQTLAEIKGAYSLALLTEREMIAVRDPNGFRPLCIGRLGDATVISSESSALNLIEAEFVREIEPGEIVIISDKGLRSIKPFDSAHKRSACFFEYVYFARPDSTIDNANVHMVRKNLGRELAREHPATADIVIPVPDSGNAAAMGYAEQSGIPFEMGIVRNHYVGRTFLQPQQSSRDFGVKIKLNPVGEVIKGKRVVLVDDSIVRGTTSRLRVKSIRDAGAREIHMRISCPPQRHACYYGIDFPDEKKLIANQLSVEEIKDFLKVDSLGYLSIDGMMNAIGRPADAFCRACWDGQYPVFVDRSVDKYVIENGGGRRS